MTYKLGARTLFFWSVVLGMRKLFLSVVIWYANTIFGPMSFPRANYTPDNVLLFAVI